MLWTPAQVLCIRPCPTWWRWWSSWIWREVHAAELGQVYHQVQGLRGYVLFRHMDQSGWKFPGLRTDHEVGKCLDAGEIIGWRLAWKKPKRLGQIDPDRMP